MAAIKRSAKNKKNNKISIELNEVGIWNKGRNVTTTNVNLTFVRGKKIRVKEFVKREIVGSSNRSKFLYKNPKKQAKSRKDLMQDIKKNNLDVLVIPTFRLVEENARPVIIASKLDIVRSEELSNIPSKLRRSLIANLQNKISDLQRIGWFVPNSEFAFVRLKTKRGSTVIAPMIVDFSKVSKNK